MRVHFFSRTDLYSRSDFRKFYILQNLNTTQTVSLIYFFISLTIRIVVEVFGLEKKVNHLEDYELSNMIALVVTPVFYVVSRQMRRIFETDNKYASISQLLVFIFALFVMLNCMRASFYTMHNPRNTLVLYLTGLIMAGILFTFEFYGSLVLALITGTVFSITLTFYQDTVSELFMNNLASFILLTIFFTLSRFSFSYRADNFFKLRAIEEKNFEIEKASQVKNEILGVVAHDLRNPLMAITLIAGMMSDDEQMNAENRENLQMIKTSCDKAASIINDLLETANNDMGGDFELVPAELNKFLLQIVDEWLKRKNADINILYYGTKNSVYALINKEKMHRVMDNLISNAVKFSKQHGRIEISLNELDGEALVTVKDFGIGIPADLLPYVFDRFSKASRKGVKGQESIGLGLNIVQQIIQKHNGRLEVDSTEGAGTAFTIYLKSGIAGH
jgi:two-component system sensor histidine kinase VicK